MLKKLCNKLLVSLNAFSRKSLKISKAALTVISSKNKWPKVVVATMR